MSAAYVYRIDAERSFKIGIATDPKRRLMGLQVGSAETLALREYWAARDAASAEAHIHKSLARYRVRGEWFSAEANEALAAVVDELLRSGELMRDVLPFARPRPARLRERGISAAPGLDEPTADLTRHAEPMPHPERCVLPIDAVVVFVNNGAVEYATPGMRGPFQTLTVRKGWAGTFVGRVHPSGDFEWSLDRSDIRIEKWITEWRDLVRQPLFPDPDSRGWRAVGRDGPTVESGTVMVKVRKRGVYRARDVVVDCHPAWWDKPAKRLLVPRRGAYRWLGEIGWKCGAGTDEISHWHLDSRHAPAVGCSLPRETPGGRRDLS